MHKQITLSVSISWELVSLIIMRHCILINPCTDIPVVHHISRANLSNSWQERHKDNNVQTN